MSVITTSNLDRLLAKGVIGQDTYDVAINKVAPALLDSVIGAESSGNPDAVSPVGAEGLMQIMPATGQEEAQKLGIENLNLKDPNQNVTIGANYLAGQIKRYNGDTRLGLAAYNHGMGNVDRLLKSNNTKNYDQIAHLLPEETRNYVTNVMSDYQANNAPLNAEPTDSKFFDRFQAANEAVSQGENTPLLTDEQVQALGKDATNELQKQQDGYDLQIEATQKAAEIGEQKAIEEQAYAQKKTDLAEQAANNELAKQQKREKLIQESNQAVEQTWQDFNKSGDLDSNRWWNKQSTGEKITNALAIILSGLGQGLQAAGGVKASNMALDVINNAIDRDIEEQKANIILKRDKWTAATQRYNQLRERFQDEDAAEFAQRELSLKAVESQILNMSSKYKSKEVQANAQQMIGELRAKQQESAARRLESVMSNPAYQDAINSQQQQTFVGQQSKEPSPISLSKENKKLYVPGVGFALDEDEAKKARESLGLFPEIIGDIDYIAKQRAKHGAEVLDRNLIADLKSRRELIANKIRKMVDMGTLDSGSQKSLDRMLPADPTEWRIDRLIPGTEDSLVTQLNSLKDSLKGFYQAGLKSKMSVVFPTVQKSLSRSSAFKKAGE